MLTTLISASVLAERLNDSDAQTVVLDCRSYLLDPGQGLRCYREGHIPTAVFIDMETDLSAPITSTSGRHPLPDFTQLSTTLAQSGISAATQVVVYDDCSGAMAVRAWWLLRMLGHTAVAVLDGGYPAWLAADYPITDKVAQMVPGNFSGEPDMSMILPLQQVAEFTTTGLLIDARSAERYRGEQEPIDPVAGHIPGAFNRPLQQNLTADGLFKPVAVLQQEWRRFMGDYEPQQVAHYCGSGVTACHNLLAMEHAGLHGSKLYPGSWSEWIRDPQRPVATGAEPQR
ncbi:sulfurtransferase [Amphritea sp. 2_MG-2023]|uniref:sulfurtransferase n=1 Tax=Amphritea TaxID=515417 RepID=UPI001C066ADA|nr:MULTISPECIES: sulfurtransferase [Amphritea]MBU2965411.1 sulfurtransferase [Amphritea atlantica]MDO6420701.1 sulfurtransferase [Amphritea sp. 2_MG-2023]